MKNCITKILVKNHLLNNSFSIQKKDRYNGMIAFSTNSIRKRWHRWSFMGKSQKACIFSIDAPFFRYPVMAYFELQSQGTSWLASVATPPQ